MKLQYYSNLGAAIPRRSKVGILLFNHAFFIGESDKMGTEIVICSWQHHDGKGFKRTWFNVTRHK